MRIWTFFPSSSSHRLTALLPSAALTVHPAAPAEVFDHRVLPCLPLSSLREKISIEIKPSSASDMVMAVGVKMADALPLGRSGARELRRSGAREGRTSARNSLSWMLSKALISGSFLDCLRMSSSEHRENDFLVPLSPTDHHRSALPCCFPFRLMQRIAKRLCISSGVMRSRLTHRRTKSSSPSGSPDARPRVVLITGAVSTCFSS